MPDPSRSAALVAARGILLPFIAGGKHDPNPQAYPVCHREERSDVAISPRGRPALLLRDCRAALAMTTRANLGTRECPNPRRPPFPPNCHCQPPFPVLQPPFPVIASPLSRHCQPPFPVIASPLSRHCEPPFPVIASPPFRSLPAPFPVIASPPFRSLPALSPCHCERSAAISHRCTGWTGLRDIHPATAPIHPIRKSSKS